MDAEPLVVLLAAQGPALVRVLALVLALAGLVWLASLRLRDASIADRFWPVFIALAAAGYAATAGPARHPWLLALLGLVAAWALRLGAFITLRNWGHGEDRRYAAMRARHGPAFAWRSLGLVFLLQALLACVVAWPVLVAALAVGVGVGGGVGAAAGTAAGPLVDGASAGLPVPLRGLALAGLVLGLAGLGVEAVADAQMAAFRRAPTGPVMDRGLWRYSRHPNYFGEACVWWGAGLVAAALALGTVAAPGGSLAAAVWLAAAALLSPALMTGLLLRVSGVTLLEADLLARRPAYRAYVARTPAFVPGRPRPGPA